MTRRGSSGVLTLALALGLGLSGCAGTEADGGPGTTGKPSSSASAAEQLFPDVLAVELRPAGDGYDVLVTISSPYDTPERYADGWRVLGPDGATLGEHTLGHDHATEQPFTRTQPGLLIPRGVTEVTVEARDQANGYGGATLTVAVPPS